MFSDRGKRLWERMSREAALPLPCGEREANEAKQGEGRESFAMLLGIEACPSARRRQMMGEDSKHHRSVSTETLTRRSKARHPLPRGEGSCPYSRMHSSYLSRRQSAFWRNAR